MAIKKSDSMKTNKWEWETDEILPSHVSVRSFSSHIENFVLLSKINFGIRRKKMPSVSIEEEIYDRPTPNSFWNWPSPTRHRFSQYASLIISLCVLTWHDRVLVNSSIYASSGEYEYAIFCVEGWLIIITSRCTRLIDTIDDWRFGRSEILELVISTYYYFKKLILVFVTNFVSTCFVFMSCVNK